MKIVMLSDAESTGGAAVAASRLAEPLTQRDHEVVRIVNAADSQRHPWRTETMRIPPSMNRVLTRVAGDTWSTARKSVAVRQLRGLLRRHKPDVINVHNLHDARDSGWSVRLLQVCCEVAPTVWTLHDEWSFTGGCAYAYTSKNFERGCDVSCQCPDDWPKPKREHLGREWLEKKSVISAGRVLGVTPSDWLRSRAQQGIWKRSRVEVIPYGLSMDRFRPKDPVEARNELGVATSKPVVLALAHDLQEKRKGGPFLREALSRVGSPITLLSAGKHALGVNSTVVTEHYLGALDQAALVLAYSAADVFVHTAPVDNLPNVLLESLACGTPILALKAGGVPEIVSSDRIGRLLPTSSRAADFAHVLEEVVQIFGKPGVREACRRSAVTRFDESDQALAYEAIFTSASEV